MKIVHIAYTDGGGAGLGLLNQHRALLAQGVESQILVVKKQTDDDNVAVMKPNLHVYGLGRIGQKIRKVICHLGIKFDEYDRLYQALYHLRLRYPIPFSMPLSQYDVACHPWVKEADVINLHFVSDMIDWPSFFARVRKPIVWTMRDENSGLGGFHYEETKRLYGHEFAPLEAIFLKIKRQAIAACHAPIHIVSLSRKMQQFCQEVDFLSGLPNTVIYNAISPHDYQPLCKTEARHRLGLKEDDIVVSFVSCSLGEERKGFSLVVEALRLLAHPRIHLLCVGRPDVEVPTGINVTILGRVSDRQQLSAVYASSDVFVNASSGESFGKTLVEALYCGTPVVSTPVGIAPEVINETNGCLCQERTAECLSRAISHVLATHYRSEKIREQAIRLFAPEQIAEQYIHLYSSFLNA